MKFRQEVSLVICLTRKFDQKWTYHVFQMLLGIEVRCMPHWLIFYKCYKWLNIIDDYSHVHLLFSIYESCFASFSNSKSAIIRKSFHWIMTICSKDVQKQRIFVFMLFSIIARTLSLTHEKPNILVNYRNLCFRFFFFIFKNSNTN